MNQEPPKSGKLNYTDCHIFQSFRNTVFNWMEHYRVVTGVLSPYKTRKIQRDLTQSAMLLPTNVSQEVWKQPRSRVPSAPTTLSEMSR